MKKLSLIVFLILTFCSCNPSSNQRTTYESSKEITITSPICPAVEDFIADYDIIRLETSDKSLLSGILKINIMNDKLYITDSSSSFVFIFTKQGKYLSKIANQGEGPQEYIKIGSFETDEANNRLLLTDSFSKRLFEYDENGQLIRVIPLTFTPNLVVSDISKRYIHTSSASKSEKESKNIRENDIHIIDKQGKITETFLKDETPRRIDIRTACAASYAENGELLYLPMLANTIFRIHGSEAIPEYTLNNQSALKSVTTDKKQELYFKYNDNNIEQAEEEGYLISCGCFLASDSLVLLDLGWEKPIYTYYSKGNKTSVTIAPDKLRGNKGLCEIFSAHPKAIENNSLYISVPVEKASYVLPMLPTESKLKKFLETTNDTDNPYIISYRLNSHLFTKLQ